MRTQQSLIKFEIFLFLSGLFYQLRYVELSTFLADFKTVIIFFEIESFIIICRE